MRSISGFQRVAGVTFTSHRKNFPSHAESTLTVALPAPVVSHWLVTRRSSIAAVVVMMFPMRSKIISPCPAAVWLYE